MSEVLKQGAVVRWVDLETQPHGEPYAPPIKAGMGTVVESACGGSLVHVINSHTQRFIYEEHLVFVCESIDRLASRVTTLEQERDAAVAGCAAWAEHNAIPSYQILDQNHAHFLGFKCKCCGGMGMERKSIAHAEDCNAKMGQPLLSRLAAAERVVEKLPKCWRLNEIGELVQDAPVAPGMELVSTFYGKPVLPPRVVVEVSTSGWRFAGSMWYDAEKAERRCYTTEAAALASQAQGGAAQ